MTAVLEPIMAELSLSRRQLVDQAETIGQLRAELAAERAKSSPDAPTATWAPEPTPEPSAGPALPSWPWLMTPTSWQHAWPRLVVVVVPIAAVVAVVLVVVPR
jgi:hypothetical protein